MHYIKKCTITVVAILTMLLGPLTSYADIISSTHLAIVTGCEELQHDAKITAELRKASAMEMGDMGRLVIPDLDTNIQMWYVINTDVVTYGQSIVDSQDAGIWQDYRPALGPDSQPLLADHYNQGFAGLKDAVPGETKAYIVHPDGTTDAYLCVDYLYGHNDEISIYDDQWQDAALQNYGGICMYTCNGCWQNIILTYWQPC